MSMPSPEARGKLLDSLRLDLVGPWPGNAFERELLPENPTRWYLTGYLVPESAPIEHRSDAEVTVRWMPRAKAAAPTILPDRQGIRPAEPVTARRSRAKKSIGARP